MSGEDRRELIEYLLLVASGAVLFVGYVEVSIIFLLAAIYLRLYGIGER